MRFIDILNEDMHLRRVLRQGDNPKWAFKDVKPIGFGSYARVFLGARNTVIKVVGANSENFLNYVTWCNEQRSMGELWTRHLPVFNAPLSGEGGSIVRMERLYKCPENWHVTPVAIQALVQTIEKKSVQIALRAATTFIDHFKESDQAETIAQAYREMKLNWGKAMDIHTCNFLLRNDGTLVFSDPVLA